MKKLICKVEYDTETSELILKKAVGNFGDADGYEESLYKTEGGKFFLYVNGGEESPYAKEDIKRMSAAKAEESAAQAKLDELNSAINTQSAKSIGKEFSVNSLGNPEKLFESMGLDKKGLNYEFFVNLTNGCLLMR